MAKEHVEAHGGPGRGSMGQWRQTPYITGRGGGIGVGKAKGAGWDDSSFLCKESGVDQAA
jgi:hypothetical protein